WLVIGAVMFLPPAVFAATQMGHVRTRITCWLDPLSSANYSSCEQISQGLFGLSNGGLTGAGLGEGRPDVVPHAESDFIFASFAEELGMVGSFALLLLYLLWSSARSARPSASPTASAPCWPAASAS